MSTQTAYLKRGTKISIRSEKKGEYKDRLAKEVKVDQTVKLQLGKSKSVKLYSVIRKVVIENGDVILSVRHLPIHRNEIPILAFVDRARHLNNVLNGGITTAHIKLLRPEMGVSEVSADLKIETLRSDHTCACCGDAILGQELAISATLRPTGRKLFSREDKGKRLSNLKKFYHFHVCMTPNQQYKTALLNQGVEHTSIEVMETLNEKAVSKARDFQIPWTILSEDRNSFMFAYDTRSIVSVIDRMREQNTPARYICRVARTSLNMEHPMSEDQFNYLCGDRGALLDSHSGKGFKYVTCAETIDSNIAVFEYGNTLDEIQNKCLKLRASNDVSCYGFATVCE